MRAATLSVDVTSGEKSLGKTHNNMGNAGDMIDTHEPADVFGCEETHDIKYKKLSWPLVAILMIAEIVSNGMLSLPSALAIVGMVPGLIMIVFLGVFATYTSWLLVKFKLRHPHVHTMGDAGYILFGVVGREIMAFGTCCFAIFACGGQLLAGQIALAALSNNRLCLVVYTAIFTIPTLLGSLPRTFHGLGWISVVSVLSIIIAGVVGMASAGINHDPQPKVAATTTATFYTAFTSITNPVFSYAGHFMFFVLISEMKKPQDAMKAAYSLQTFATLFYAIFAGVTYGYIGQTVTSPSFSSLTPYWQRVAYGIAIPNFILAGSLYSHTASKLIFVRIFRHSKHLHSHTVKGWGTWFTLVLVTNGLAFLLAVGVPIFNYLVGLAASLFAAWFTYGIAGMFWLHDTYYDDGGFPAWRRKPVQTCFCIFTILTGAFICVAGFYVTVRGIVDAYAQGLIAPAFTC